MAFKYQRRKMSNTCPVQLAVNAIVDGNVHPLDQDLRHLDPSPTSLDLVDDKDAVTCLHHRWICADCGRALNGHPS
jgi:hypothetical protein